MFGRVGNTGLALLSLGATGSVMAAMPIPMPIQCSATGTKSFAPAMTAPEVCARFIRALGVAAKRPVSPGITAPRDGLVVELRFLPGGMASARATRLSAGESYPLPLYELAVSDRSFSLKDIDTLAADVERGLKIKMGAR